MESCHYTEPAWSSRGIKGVTSLPFLAGYLAYVSCSLSPELEAYPIQRWWPSFQIPLSPSALDLMLIQISTPATQPFQEEVIQVHFLLVQVQGSKGCSEGWVVIGWAWGYINNIIPLKFSRPLVYLVLVSSAVSDHIPRSYLDVVFKTKDSNPLFIGHFHDWVMAIFWLSETTGLGRKAPFFFAKGLTAFLKRALVSTPPGSATLQLPLISASVQKQLAF